MLSSLLNCNSLCSLPNKPLSSCTRTGVIVALALGVILGSLGLLMICKVKVFPDDFFKKNIKLEKAVQWGTFVSGMLLGIASGVTLYNDPNTPDDKSLHGGKNTTEKNFKKLQPLSKAQKDKIIQGLQATDQEIIKNLCHNYFSTYEQKNQDFLEIYNSITDASSKTIFLIAWIQKSAKNDDFFKNHLISLCEKDSIDITALVNSCVLETAVRDNYYSILVTYYIDNDINKALSFFCLISSLTDCEATSLIPWLDQEENRTKNEEIARTFAKKLFNKEKRDYFLDFFAKEDLNNNALEKIVDALPYMSDAMNIAWATILIKKSLKENNVDDALGYVESMPPFNTSNFDGAKDCFDALAEFCKNSNKLSSLLERQSNQKFFLHKLINTCMHHYIINQQDPTILIQKLIAKQILIETFLLQEIVEYFYKENNLKTIKDIFFQNIRLDSSEGTVLIDLVKKYLDLNKIEEAIFILSMRFRNNDNKIKCIAMIIENIAVENNKSTKNKLKISPSELEQATILMVNNLLAEDNIKNLDAEKYELMFKRILFLDSPKKNDLLKQWVTSYSDNHIKHNTKDPLLFLHALSILLKDNEVMVMKQLTKLEVFASGNLSDYINTPDQFLATINKYPAGSLDIINDIIYLVAKYYIDRNINYALFFLNKIENRSYPSTSDSHNSNMKNIETKLFLDILKTFENDKESKNKFMLFLCKFYTLKMQDPSFIQKKNLETVSRNFLQSTKAVLVKTAFQTLHQQCLDNFSTIDNNYDLCLKIRTFVWQNHGIMISKLNC